MGKTSLVYVCGSLTAKGARFLLIPIYVRHLVPSDVGILVFAEAISVALSRALRLGVGQAVKRFYVEHTTEREADNFVAALWCLCFAFATAIGGLLLAGVLLYGHHLTRQVPAELLALAVVSGILRSNITIALERFIVRLEPYRHGLFNIGQFVTTALLIIIAVVVLKLGVRGALWADISALAVWNAITAVIVSKGRRPTFLWPELRAAIRYSIPVIPHSLFTWALTFGDRIILERFVHSALLAVYGVGYQLASVLPIFSLAIVDSWIPRFFRSAGEDAGPGSYARVFTLQLAAIIGIALPLIAFAPEIIGIVATPEYSGAVPIMRVVAVGLIGHGIYQALLLPLFYGKRTALVSVTTGSALFVNVALNLLLIPRIGIMGAAIATLLGFVATVAVAGAFVARHYPVALDYRRLGLVAAVATVAATVAIIVDSATPLSAVPLKMGALTLFYAPVAFIPGFIVSGEPSIAQRLLRNRIRKNVPRGGVPERARN